MASRRNVSVAQSRKGRRPMSVQTLLRKEKDGTLYKNTKLSSALEDARDTTTEALNKIKSDNRYSKAVKDLERIKGSLKEFKGVDFPIAKTDIKTRWARLLERRGEKTAGSLKYRKDSTSTKMENPYPPAEVENRQENQQTKLVDTSNELTDPGKIASPVRETLKAGLKVQIKGQTHDNTKEAMLDELKALGALTPNQIQKVASAVTYTEAKDSLKRLNKLEQSAPTAGEVARGGGVGAVVMPISALAWRAVAGPKGRVAGPKGPQQIWPGGRPMAATAAQGAVLGGLLPAGRHHLEQEVEKQKLKEYAGQRRRGTLRGRIRSTLGI